MRNHPWREAFCWVSLPHQCGWTHKIAFEHTTKTIFICHPEHIVYICTRHSSAVQEGAVEHIIQKGKTKTAIIIIISYRTDPLCSDNLFFFFFLGFFTSHGIIAVKRLVCFENMKMTKEIVYDMLSKMWAFCNHCYVNLLMH